MTKNEYPTTRADKIALAQAVLNDLTADAAEFPDSPIKADELEVLLNKAVSDRNVRIMADANAREKMAIENDSFDDLNNALKSNIKRRAGYEKR